MLYGDTMEHIKRGLFATQEQARDMAGELIELRRKASGFAGREASFVQQTGDLRAQVAAIESQLAALKARLAVLGRVEEMFRADRFLEYHIGVDAYGSYYAAPMSAKDGRRLGDTRRDATLLDALAALVDGKEGG